MSSYQNWGPWFANYSVGSSVRILESGSLSRISIGFFGNGEGQRETKERDEREKKEGKEEEKGDYYTYIITR